MAFTPYHNVLGANVIDTELLAAGDNSGSISSIVLTNVHVTADATVSLYIAKLSDPIDQNAEEKYYILSTVAIPSDTSLVLDSHDVLSFDNSSSGYALYLTVGSTDTVDVLIKRKE